MKKSIQLVQIPFAKKQTYSIDQQDLFPADGQKFSAFEISKLFEPININNKVLSPEISSYKDIFSIDEEPYGKITTEIVSDEYNFDEDEGEEEDISVSEEKDLDPIIVAIPSPICGKFTDFMWIASIWNEKNPDINIYAIDDNQQGLLNNRSIEAVSEQYLNLLCENFPYFFESSENVPERKIILITYSSSFAIAISMIRLLKMRIDSVQNVFQIIALDPTPKDYFSFLPGEDESRKLTCLLTSAIQTYLNNNSSGNLIVQKSIKVDQQIDLSSNKESIQIISAKIVDLIKKPSESLIIDVTDSLFRLSEQFYTIQNSIVSYIKEEFTNIIINFFALYEWHNESEKDFNRIAIQEICRKNTLMINAGFSVLPDGAPNQNTHASIDYGKKTLGWGKGLGDIKQVEIIPKSRHMRLFQVFAYSIVYHSEKFYSKIKLEQVKNHIEYIKQLNNRGEEKLDYWKNIYDDLMSKQPQEEQNTSGKQDDSSKAVEVMTKGKSGWGGCLQPISSNDSTSTVTIEEQPVISDEINRFSVISNMPLNN